MNKKTAAGAVVAVLAAGGSIVGVMDATCNPSLWAQTGLGTTIESKLVGKDAKERANIQGCEIANLNPTGTYEAAEYDVTIEILEVEKINEGVQVYARAWDENGKPIGFSKDGSVEIERFQFYNPPVLVPDEAGEVQRALGKYREDGSEALREALAHTVSTVGKRGTKVVMGKRGNTTATVFTSGEQDGHAYRGGQNETAAAIEGGTGNANVDTGASLEVYLESTSTSNQFAQLNRVIAMFDTTSLPDSITVNSATLHAYGASLGKIAAASPTVNIYGATTASDTTVSNADYQNVGSTAFSTAIAYASISTVAYNDFALNASGLAVITGTALSKFSMREAAYDAGAGTYPWQSNAQVYSMTFHAAEQDGGTTTRDIKLVIDYTEVVAVPADATVWFD